MSAEHAEGHSASGRLPVATWGFGVALLALEYVLALLLFDADRLPIRGDTEAFRYLGQAMPLVIVVMTAALLFGGELSEQERRSLSSALAKPRRIWPWAIAHLFAYSIAIAVTVFVFNAGAGEQHPWLWVGLWAGAGLTAFVLWLRMMIPPGAVAPLRKPVARALGSGIVVGLLALAAGYATSIFWRPMSQMTLEIVAFLLELTGHEVVSIPDELVVGTEWYQVIVDRPCSGYEGIGLIVVMLSFYLFFFRKSLRFPNAFLLLPIGIALIWLANSVRVAALVAVGAWVSPDIAEGGFHSAAGWLLFCTIALLLVSVSKRHAWFTVHPTRNAGLRTPEGAFLLPLLALIGTSLFTGLLRVDFDYLYPIPVLVTLIPLWIFRDDYRALRCSWSWTPVGYGMAAFALWMVLEPQADPEAAALIPSALSEMSRLGAVTWVLSRVVGSVVVVPIAEELAFRGYLLRRLISADFTSVSPGQFTVVSFLVSSVAFGLLHERWIAGILVGMIYAAAQYRRGEILDAIVAHGVTNGLIAAYVLLFDAWELW